MNIKSRAVITGIFAAALSLMSVAAPAHAADLTILDIGNGALVRKRIAVEVPVTFVCPAEGADEYPGRHRGSPAARDVQEVRAHRGASRFTAQATGRGSPSASPSYT